MERRINKGAGNKIRYKLEYVLKTQSSCNHGNVDPLGKRKVAVHIDTLCSQSKAMAKVLTGIYRNGENFAKVGQMFSL